MNSKQSEVLPETPFRERLRLRREIDERQNRLHVISKAADAELILRGLRWMGRKKHVLDVKELNALCVSGNFRTRDWHAKQFGLESHHGIVTADVAPGISACITIDDTFLSIQVSWPSEDSSPGFQKRAGDDLVKNLARTRKFFRKFGITIDCRHAMEKASSRAAELVHFAKMVNEFKGSPLSKKTLQEALAIEESIALLWKTPPQK
jgi:hypothetical protein